MSSALLLLVIGVTLRTGQAVEAGPAVMKAAAQLIADRPAITPCPGPHGRQSSGIHSGKTSPRTEEAALSGSSATPAGTTLSAVPGWTNHAGIGRQGRPPARGSPDYRSPPERAASASRTPIPIAPGQMAVLNYRRADHPFRCRPSDMPIVEVLLTMGQLN